MNTKQAAQKWGCSVKTVTKLCADGVIPLAEKDERGRWVIPDECEKPPVSRFRLCFLMDMINQLKEGVIFQQVKWGISEKELQDGYQYLIENAMVSSFDVRQLEKELPNANITSRDKSKPSKARCKARAICAAALPVGAANAIRWPTGYWWQYRYSIAPRNW